MSPPCPPVATTTLTLTLTLQPSPSPLNPPLATVGGRDGDCVGDPALQGGERRQRREHGER